MNQAGEKMKKDCSLSRLEQGRSERHHLVNWKTYKYDGTHWGRTSECNDVRQRSLGMKLIDGHRWK
jgi:hypothetical protein